MKAVLVQAMKNAKIIDIENKLEALQGVVGGYIEAVYPFDDNVCLVCNDEGKINGMMPNRALYDNRGRVYDIVFGDFLVVGLSADDFGDLSDEQAKKYEKLYRWPEVFFKDGDEIIAVEMI